MPEFMGYGSCENMTYIGSSSHIIIMPDFPITASNAKGCMH